ncbi:unnamed protein product [Blepharisma stoltei]|uniref:Uncharacterized protein n=1 Tax=Blepharisma stoltei TaxID=1481888 RepID=A0AAU9JM18_9CILI|nr:unnamed protein product [Blepharisma stoltei]
MIKKAIFIEVFNETWTISITLEVFQWNLNYKHNFASISCCLKKMFRLMIFKFLTFSYFISQYLWYFFKSLKKQIFIEVFWINLKNSITLKVFLTV